MYKTGGLNGSIIGLEVALPPPHASWSQLHLLELVLENQVSLSLVTLTMCPIVTVIKEIYFDNMNYDKLKIRYYEHFQNQ